jgi:1,2-diacylglycerol-3-alpha-glucose alpha-1,2-galactosyltransferase
VIRVSMISESDFTVQGHGVHTAYVELTNALRKRADVSVTVNNGSKADITHIHTVGLYSLRYLLFGKSKKVVSAHIVPASLVGSLIGAKFWLPLASRYLKWFYNRADMIFAVSGETKKVLKSIGVKSPIEVVHNVIDTAQYLTTPADKAAAREALGISPDAWVVVGAGQVQPRKRIDSFVKAASALPETKFIWVGGMPFGKLAAENSSMQSYIDNATENVTFTGVIKLEAVKQYYQAADVFWLPSEQETFGLVVVEAAAAGLPVVLRNIQDYEETFASDAILVEEEDTVPMLELLKNDKAFYDKATTQASHIATRYDAVSGAEHVVSFYKKLLSK